MVTVMYSLHSKLYTQMYQACMCVKRTNFETFLDKLFIKKKTYRKSSWKYSSLARLFDLVMRGNSYNVPFSSFG